MISSKIQEYYSGIVVFDNCCRCGRNLPLGMGVPAFTYGCKCENPELPESILNHKLYEFMG